MEDIDEERRESKTRKSKRKKKEMKKSSNGKIKKVLSHIKEDSKEFKKQLSDDQKLKKMLTSKDQGYNDKLDDSLGGRTRKKMKQSMKSRRKESEGIEKEEGKRKYSTVKTMDRKRTAKKPIKVEKVMKEYKSGKLHSGSSKGPKVKNKKQALAIALSEAGMARK